VPVNNKRLRQLNPIKAFQRELKNFAVILLKCEF
jgi:hypothetical protein